MKRIALIVFIMLIVPAFAYASDFENAAIIASSYQYWASSFGATDLSQDIDIQDITGEDGKQRLYTDDLVIDFYSSIPDIVFETDQVVLFSSIHTGGTSAYNQSRTLGLFAALEYGAPTQFNTKEIDDAYAIAQNVFADYSLAMVSNYEKLYAGDLVLFRMNERGRYYVSYYDKVGFSIMVQ